MRRLLVTLDAATAEDVVRAMAAARESARAGDTSACEQALADVEHSIGC
jgi:hypothetical protein